VQMRQLVRYGVIPAGTHEFMYDSKHPCEVEVLPDGDILYQGDLYESLAKFGKSLLEDSRSRKQSCNCWKDISWKGQRLEELRQTAHAKHMEAKRVK